MFGHTRHRSYKSVVCGGRCSMDIKPRDGPALVEIGDCLDAMTSELKTNEIISEFVSGGHKNYAYKTFNSLTCAGKTVCKVKVITLNYNISQLVNFENIKDMVLKGNEKETVIVHTENKIKRKIGKG